jgi:hypothetical protein
VWACDGDLAAAGRWRYPESVSSRRWPIRVGRRSRLVLRLWTARPETAYATLDDELEIAFGRLRFRTPIANIAGWRIEGPWRWITAIGVRRSVRHGDVSFCGDGHGGVRLDLRERVTWGPFHVPAVWVGADDLEGFAEELTALGIPGIDARRQRRRRRFRLGWPWNWFRHR